MAQLRPMFFKGQKQFLEIGRPKQDHMRVIRRNENTHKRTFLDENYTTNHNTMNYDKNS